MIAAYVCFIKFHSATRYLSFISSAYLGEGSWACHSGRGFVNSVSAWRATHTCQVSTLQHVAPGLGTPCPLPPGPVTDTWQGEDSPVATSAGGSSARIAMASCGGSSSLFDKERKTPVGPASQGQQGRTFLEPHAAPPWTRQWRPATLQIKFQGKNNLGKPRFAVAG